MFDMKKIKPRVVARQVQRTEKAATREMTQADVKAWRASWQRVNEFHIQEIRRMPRLLKLQQANLMFQIAQNMNLRHSLDDPEIAALRKRWAKVKRRYEENSSRTYASRANAQGSPSPD